jgi:hypothetical protein
MKAAYVVTELAAQSTRLNNSTYSHNIPPLPTHYLSCSFNQLATRWLQTSLSLLLMMLDQTCPPATQIISLYNLPIDADDLFVVTRVDW